MPIYVPCSDNNKPIGGIRVIYRYVDILNELGYSAYVLHHRRNFRATWFKNDTAVAYVKDGWMLLGPDSRITRKLYELTGIWPFPREIRLIDAPSTRLSTGDYLLLPALLADSYFKSQLFTKNIVILNQNAYSVTFKVDGFPKNGAPWYENNIRGVVVVSADNEKYLKNAFPQLQVYRHRLSINPNIFHYSAEKRKIIAFMPRKNKEHAKQVVNILKLRNNINDFEILPIHNASEAQVGEILRKSLIFLSFSEIEGFGLPPAEAMACGCIVIGYHGMGGREFFKDEFSYPVETGDIYSFVKTIEMVVAQYQSAPEVIMNKAENASRFIAARYSLEEEKASVKVLWETLTKNY